MPCAFSPTVSSVGLSGQGPEPAEHLPAGGFFLHIGRRRLGTSRPADATTMQACGFATTGATLRGTAACRRPMCVHCLIRNCSWAHGCLCSRSIWLALAALLRDIRG